MIKAFIQMYFNKNIVKDFAEHEQNEKNFKVAEILDAVIMQAIGNINKDFRAVELGGGAHPDRYHNLFNELINKNGIIDWVDISPYMLEVAKEYIDTEEYRKRFKVINFIESDILSYLMGIPDESLDLAIMKYTIDHIKDIEILFSLLQKKLKQGGVLVSTIGILSPELKSISTNARFLFNGEEFPENEIKELRDGDTFTVKFFNVSGKPEYGYIHGGETTKYFHSKEKYEGNAKKNGFKLFLGDWKGIIEQSENQMQQDILMLKK